MTGREKRSERIRLAHEAVSEFLHGIGDGDLLTKARVYLREARMDGGALTDTELGYINLWMEERARV